ncbi:hypothetical protein Rhe02_37210 [Rhizocola hellebori]|uniref:MmcQ/YjbR family DNA-binding protein n=1 Tax=Rhizocola hellebori TaxID=1392758 RepID=A0A8J3Q7W1_9ACTN|nr:MmcQ/YjbR family DNA-binding protein [Rhizocola hellebori]GIH05654.1 hypothetical protein Rhe02_37210 [Rhizocola hellebori]
MATWEEADGIAAALPEVEGAPDGWQWKVKGKAFAWERPLRKGDLAELGEHAPQGDILAAWVPDQGAKEALLADEHGHYFTTSHFNGYAIVLVKLESIDASELRELLVEAWLARAPKRLAKQFLDAAV